MSGAVYDIAKRAVNAYINTGSIPQYVATQVERDVLNWMQDKIGKAKADAWAEAMRYAEREGYLIVHAETVSNPYRSKS